ncbi:MAG: hypothetical protein HJJLKODD_02520 [Phycisphaerae bacterium]|nr:hypothetical protein [Phycisphaerae bacterium]
MKNLLPHHLADLRKSGLTDETIAACGFYSESRYSELARIVNWSRWPKKMGHALIIPFIGMDGSNGYYRLKPDNPRVGKNNKPAKYESPKGQPSRAFFPPGTREKIHDVTLPLILTEGEKKSARADQEGFCCIGLTGVWNWKNGDSETLIPDLLAITWQDRETYIAFDSDIITNQMVHLAESRLAAQLKIHGATVRCVRLPAGPNGEKVGLDDYLLAHSADELRELMTVAIEPLPVEPVIGEAGDLGTRDPAELAGMFLSDMHTVDGLFTLARWRGQFWRYTGARWAIITDEALRAELTRWIESKVFGVKRDLLGNTENFIIAKTIIDDRTEQNTWLTSDGPRNCLALRNGILDIDALLSGHKELLPHSPSWFSPTALNYEFNPQADCPKWLAFLNKNLEADAERIGLLQEWFGYCLLPDTSQQKFIVFEGDGANGKSVACAVLTALLGAENVSHVPLEAFTQRFALNQTIGKLANVASEIGELDKVGEGFLKQFTSGDRMMFDRKHIAPIEALPTARLVLATNNRPRFSDRTSGLWRRMIVLPWRIRIAEHERITGMDKSAYWADELPGIFGWAIVGLHRLRQQGRFTEPEICREALAEYRIECNPCGTFLSERYVTGAGYQSCGELYANYADWSRSNGYHPLGEIAFGKEVRRTFPDVERKQIGPGKTWCYTGLVVR